MIRITKVFAQKVIIGFASGSTTGNPVVEPLKKSNYRISAESRCRASGHQKRELETVPLVFDLIFTFF